MPYISKCFLLTVVKLYPLYISTGCPKVRGKSNHTLNFWLSGQILKPFGMVNPHTVRFVLVYHIFFMCPSAKENMGYVPVKILSKKKISRNSNVYLSRSSISMNQLTCRMLCVHHSWWLEDVKEKIITAVDDIHNWERQIL